MNEMLTVTPPSVPLHPGRARGMMLVIVFLSFLALAMSAARVHAQPLEKLAQLDAEAQSRILRLSEILRCVVCQNQTLADSHAELAQDIKRELRAQVLAGASDEAVLHFMVQRYGEFVLYRPPFKPSTWVLWLGPLLLLSLSAAGLYRVLAHPARIRSTPDVDAENRVVPS
jgi:cytochrome c-type biogenesis protein CcmH